MPIRFRIAPKAADGSASGAGAPASVRPPAVAGRFYPADPAALAGQVDRFLENAAPAWGIRPKAVIAPHAGYVFSGAVAGTAFAALDAAAAAAVTRVVLMAPAHRMAVHGLAAPSVDGFRTPLGTVPVDRDGVATALAQPGVAILDAAFDGEHAIEVELPFVQRRFPGAAVVPLLVGEASPDTVARVLAALWGGPETLVAISSDLSHYHPREAAAVLDDRASRAIEVQAPERLSGELACGHRAIGGLLAQARATDMRATTLQHADSGDAGIAGCDRVVGYGAYAVEPAGTAALPPPLRRRLGEAVAEALARQVAGEADPLAGMAGAVPRTGPLGAWRNSFVTLEIGGRLRGCIGSLNPWRPLLEDVAGNAVKAAAADPRFAPLRRDELPRVEAAVSILGRPRPLAAADEPALLEALVPGVDGLILEDGGRRGLFLPKVWDSLPDPRRFVARLKQKAGLAEDHWSPDLKVWRFSAETFQAA